MAHQEKHSRWSHITKASLRARGLEGGPSILVIARRTEITEVRSRLRCTGTAEGLLIDRVLKLCSRALIAATDLDSREGFALNSGQRAVWLCEDELSSCEEETAKQGRSSEHSNEGTKLLSKLVMRKDTGQIESLQCTKIGKQMKMLASDLDQCSY